MPFGPHVSSVGSLHVQTVDTPAVRECFGDPWAPPYPPCSSRCICENCAAVDPDAARRRALAAASIQEELFEVMELLGVSSR